MLLYPNCKLNIGLHILRKRPDNFHDLETVFYPINLHDCLEIKTCHQTQNKFTSTGIQIDGNPEQNLCLKAHNLLTTYHELPFVQIHLHKQIPIGGGLGGGSADAAFALKAFNELGNLQLSTQELEQYAAQLGSDCAFFIQNKPAFAEGRGEVLQPIELDLSGYSIAVINPRIHISTQAAFANIIPREPAFSLRKLPSLPLEDWKNHIHNDFEDSVFPQYPELATIKQQLYELGAHYAAMSGSGSTMFGIFENCADGVSKSNSKSNLKTDSSSISKALLDKTFKCMDCWLV